jgi:flagellar hook-length control protein FliK
MDGGHRPSPMTAGVAAKAGPLAETDRSAQRQNGSDSQSLPKAASTPAALTATPEEGPSQNFASLVESLEKSGGAGKHLGADADTALDTLGPSGARGHATAPSAPVNAAKGEPAPTQPLPREEVVQQIVDSARLRLGSGQSEMRIQLKPEHLGRVQLNIATEQQQVVVKVVADLPMVKELLESNLHHLRTELQGQGLEIHKFDVSVGGDSGAQNREQQAWGQQPGGRRQGAFAQSDADKQEEGFGAKRQRPQVMASAAEGVDYFA